MFGKNSSSNNVRNNQLAEQLRGFDEDDRSKSNGSEQVSSGHVNMFASINWPEKLTPDQRVLLGIGMQDLRKKAGTTQSTLARLCDLPSNYITMLEKGSVAKVDKALLGKIANILRCDFTDLMKSVIAPIKINAGKSATALPASLECGEEQTYKVKGHNFELKANISERNFRLSIVNREGIEIEIYTGNREKNHLFLQAMDKIITKISKGI